MESPQSDFRFHFQNQNQGVVGPQFCAANPIELTVKKTGNRFSGPDFNILDSNGNLVLTVDRPLFTRRDTRILRDQVGNALITLRRKSQTLHQTWRAYRGEGNGQENLVFTARRSSLFQVRTSLEVYLGPNSNADMKVKGSLQGWSYTFYQGTAVIAQMRRKNVFGRLKYAISVNPGVDYAFIVAMVVIIEGNSDSNM